MSEENRTFIRKWFEEVWNEVDFMKFYSQIGALAPNE